ncbi:hypothetical protein GCM10010129_81810 [Streptomyces fumigatiscleroticus]|nr:hypothetical protein GCM10010129_81810 [Streptomyces fumigatiscleroticus]
MAVRGRPVSFRQRAIMHGAAFPKGDRLLTRRPPVPAGPAPALPERAPHRPQLRHQSRNAGQAAVAITAGVRAGRRSAVSDTRLASDADGVGGLGRRKRRDAPDEVLLAGPGPAQAAA